MWQPDLSVQQGEALLLLAQGLSHDTLAKRMRIAPSAADGRMRPLYSTLGVHAKGEAIACVLAAGEETVKS